jgi:hypothetical protein
VAFLSGFPLVVFFSGFPLWFSLMGLLGRHLSYLVLYRCSQYIAPAQPKNQKFTCTPLQLTRVPSDY